MRFFISIKFHEGLNMIDSVLEPFSPRSTMQAETQKEQNQRCTSWPPRWKWFIDCHLPCLFPLWTGTLMRAPHHLQHVQGWGCWVWWCQWWKTIWDGLCVAADHGCCDDAAPGDCPSGGDLGLRCQILSWLPCRAGSGGWSHVSSYQLRLSSAQLQAGPQEQKGSQSHGNMAPKGLWSQRGKCRLLILQRRMRRKRKKGHWSGRSACVAGGKAALVPVQTPSCSPYSCGRSYRKRAVLTWASGPDCSYLWSRAWICSYLLFIYSPRHTHKTAGRRIPITTSAETFFSTCKGQIGTLTEWEMRRKRQSRGQVRDDGTVRWRVQQRAEGWIQSRSVRFGSKQTAMLVESIERDGWSESGMLDESRKMQPI